MLVHVFVSAPIVLSVYNWLREFRGVRLSRCIHTTRRKYQARTVFFGKETDMVDQYRGSYIY